MSILESMRRLLISLTWLLISSAAAAQSLHPVKGFLPDLRFTLKGLDERVVTQDDFKGQVVLLFFGYASCPDICPTTMAQLSQVMDTLDHEESKQVRILFISVDPHRDTPELLHQYVTAFDQHAIGLTGSEQQIADFARRYRVAYQIEKPKADKPDSYEVAHSRGVYFFDRHGKARFLAPDSESVPVLAEGVKQLLLEAL